MINPIVSLSRSSYQLGCLAAAGSLGLAAAMFHPWPLLGAAALFAMHLRNKRRVSDAFGSGGFATAGDLISANLLGQSSGLPLGYPDASTRPNLALALGRLFLASPSKANAAVRLFSAALGNKRAFAGYPIRWQGNHAVVFGAPGSGKSAGLFFNALKMCPEPAFVFDPKRELVRTAHFRARRFGHKIYIIDPFGNLQHGTHCYNPLADIDPANPFAADDLLDLANAMVFRTGREPDSYWLDQAVLTIFAAMAFSLTHGSPAQRHLLECQEIIADSEARAAAIEAMKQSGDLWGGTVRRLGNQLSQFRDREEASVISSTLRQLSWLHSQPIAQCLRQSSFHLGEVVHGKADVYVVLPPERIVSQAPFLRLHLASMIRRLFREGISNNVRVRIYLDEAAALGKMPCVDQALAIGRGFGAAMIFGLQSMGQLLANFPEGQHQTFLSCLGCQIFMGAPSDYQGAEYLQNLLGDQTIGITSSQVSTSRSYSSGCQSAQEQVSTSHSTTYSEHGRKLLFAAEAFNLAPRQAIVFLPGQCRPVVTTMVRHFEDRELAAGWGRRMVGHLRILLQAVSFLTLAVFLLAVLIAVSHRQAVPQPLVAPMPNNAPMFNPTPVPTRPNPAMPQLKQPPAPDLRWQRAGEKQ